MNQYKIWIGGWLPNEPQLHTLGAAAISWAIWKNHNKACFEKSL